MLSRTTAEPMLAPPASHAELLRVLASRTFAKSPRLCELLDFIGHHTLEGRTDELTEQQIGIHVFHRPPGYNSGEDTIVRGTARHLRQRLDLYYQEEGRLDPVRISVPKGGYVATFEPWPEPSGVPVHQPEPVPLLEPPPAILSASTAWPRASILAIAVLATVSVVLLASLLALLLHRQKPERLTGPQPLWNALFTPGRKTIIVPGDASLDAYIAWEQQDVNLQDYSNQHYQQHITVSRPPSNKDVPLSSRSVTPMADLRLVAELVRVPEHMGLPQAANWIDIRYARDIVVADTHDNNLILIGARTFNPWITLYQPALDFEVQWDYKSDVYSVINRAPKPGERSRYEYNRRLEPGQPLDPLTHIALMDNTQGHGRVLLIEGTSMGSTYAALAFLSNEQLWQPILARATEPNGQLHNFEVLLGSEFVRGGVSNTRLVAFHEH